MGKAARVACIFTPMALTIASLVCVILINMGGWSRTSSTLNNLYFMEADFSNYTSNPSNTSALSLALDAGRSSKSIADLYQIHLWNYCNGTVNKDGVHNITYCSPRQHAFWFNPVEEWSLNQTATNASQTGDSALDNLKSNVTALENKLLGEGAEKSLKAYQRVAGWMFAMYTAAFWFLLATLLFGILAIFSRWGSFITWIASVVASVTVFAASIISTILFTALVEALRATLHGHDISITLSRHTLGVTWLAALCSCAATLFWLFSACCCSGKSNPHHHSNRSAPAADGVFGAGFKAPTRGRGGLRVEKTAGGYERVASPFLGAGHDDHVPLRDMGAMPGQGHMGAYSEGGYAGAYGGQRHQGGGGGGGGAFEPYRHG